MHGSEGAGRGQPRLATRQYLAGRAERFETRHGFCDPFHRLVILHHLFEVA